jgi:hypothetical protein
MVSIAFDHFKRCAPAAVAFSALIALQTACGVPTPLRKPPILKIKKAKKTGWSYDVTASPWQPPHTFEERPSPPHVPFAGGVKVGRIAIEAEGHVTEEQAKRFRDVLVKRLEQAFPPLSKDEPKTRIDLRYVASYTHKSSALAAYTVLSFGLFPLGLQFGHARASATAVISVPGKGAPYRSSGYSSKKYTIVLYPWFRVAPIDEAFDKVHQHATWRLIRMLRRTAIGGHTMRRVKDRSFLTRSIFGTRPRGGRVRFDFLEDGTLRTQMDTSSFRIIGDDLLYDMDKQQKAAAKIKAGKVSVNDKQSSFWWRYLSSLSGLEAGAFFGTAWVRSQAIDPDTKQAFTIASGKASSRGWKLDFYTPPTTSGVFIFPTLGFFSLDINIADVAGDVPLGGAAGSQEIPGVGSDPATGERVDLGAPNSYSLRLRSGYIGQRVGSNFVWGNANFQFFATGQLGLNLLEWRYTDVRLGRYKETGHSAKFLHSFAARAVVGAVYRPWHVMLRCELNYELYREFDYPQPIPFEGKVRYNEQLQAYERPEIKVDAATVHTLNGFCGAGFHY